MKQLVLVGLILLTLSSCAKNLGDAFSTAKTPENPDMSTVVFYRPDQVSLFFGVEIRWPIAVDGQRVSGLGEEAYTIVKMPAGKHQFNTQTGAIDTREIVTTQAGKVHYFKVRRVGYSFWTYILIEEKSEQEAMPELSHYREQINTEAWIRKTVTSNLDADAIPANN